MWYQNTAAIVIDSAGNGARRVPIGEEGGPAEDAGAAAVDGRPDHGRIILCCAAATVSPAVGRRIQRPTDPRTPPARVVHPAPDTEALA